MAQHAPFGDDPAAAAVEQRAHVENALARKAAAVKAVHIQLPARAAVGVGAARPCEHARPVRGVRALQLGGHARVQQTVAVRDHAAPRVHDRAVERMEHRAHERACSARCQARVGVERQQVYRAAQARRVPGGALQRARPVEHQPRQLQ